MENPMIFETGQPLGEHKAAEPDLKWPDNYFAELDPQKRKSILDAAKAADAEHAAWLEKLFELRYKKGKNGAYADQFLGCFLQLKMTAENLDVMFGERKNRKTVQKNLQKLGLDADSGFPQELMYRELCQVTLRYIKICTIDKNYTSVIWGLGKKSDSRIAEKIRLDLIRIGEAIPGYLHMEQEFQILTRAIRDTRDRYLGGE